MKKLNEYERHAYLYPAWVAMIVPMFVTGLLLWHSNILENIGVLIRVFSMFVPMAIIYAAIGYAVRELFRSTSKLLFQFRLFREDETKMPTTELLLYKNKLMSKNQNDNIRRNVLENFGLAMMSPEEELQDEHEARLNIVDAVGNIRNVTRGNKILEQANYRYGFCRNLLGGLFWALIIMAVLFVGCLFLYSSYWWIPLVGIAIVIAQGFLTYWGYKVRARDYARSLFYTYMATKAKK